MLSLLFFYRNYGLTIEDEFELDDGIISGSFDNTFDMGIVGTLCGSLWYICWITDRSKTRLIASHTDKITGLIPIEDTHIVTSSLDGTIRIFQLEDRNEVLCFNANELVNLKFSYLNIFYFHFCFFLESNLFNIMG
jgi:WD40 repeat protein